MENIRKIKVPEKDLTDTRMALHDFRYKYGQDAFIEILHQILFASSKTANTPEERSFYSDCYHALPYNEVVELVPTDN